MSREKLFVCLQTGTNDKTMPIIKTKEGWKTRADSTTTYESKEAAEIALKLSKPVKKERKK